MEKEKRYEEETEKRYEDVKMPTTMGKGGGKGKYDVGMEPNSAPNPDYIDAGQGTVNRGQDTLNGTMMKAREAQKKAYDAGYGTMKSAKMPKGKYDVGMEPNSAPNPDYIDALQGTVNREQGVSAGYGTMKSAKSAKGKLGPEEIMMKKAQGKKMADERSSGNDLGAVTTSLNNLNNTIKKTLTAIESRLKKNNVNPALTKMNEILGEINDSMPEPASGGGYSRRLRVKKGSKMSRKRNTT